MIIFRFNKHHSKRTSASAPEVASGLLQPGQYRIRIEIGIHMYTCGYFKMANENSYTIAKIEQRYTIYIVAYAHIHINTSTSPPIVIAKIPEFLRKLFWNSSRRRRNSLSFLSPCSLNGEVFLKMALWGLICCEIISA